MTVDELVVGQEFYGVLGKLVRDHDGNRKRVITIKGQVVPEGMYIECSKKIREKNEFGTVFKLNVGVSRKPVGVLYFYSLKKQELLVVDEWEAIYGGRSTTL